jgi:hypothetical protein
VRILLSTSATPSVAAAIHAIREIFPSRFGRFSRASFGSSRAILDGGRYDDGMFRLGQSVSLAEAKPAVAVLGSRRRALLALLPSDQQIVACLKPPVRNSSLRPVVLVAKSP